MKRNKIKLIVLILLNLLISSCIETTSATDSTYKGDPNNPGIIKSINKYGHTVFESISSIYITGLLKSEYLHENWEIPILNYDSYESMSIGIEDSNDNLIILKDNEYKLKEDTLIIYLNSLISEGNKFNITLIYLEE